MVEAANLSMVHNPYLQISAAMFTRVLAWMKSSPRAKQLLMERLCCRAVLAARCAWPCLARPLDGELVWQSDLSKELQLFTAS